MSADPPEGDKEANLKRDGLRIMYGSEIFWEGFR